MIRCSLLIRFVANRDTRAAIVNGLPNCQLTFRDKAFLGWQKMVDSLKYFPRRRFYIFSAIVLFWGAIYFGLNFLNILNCFFPIDFIFYSFLLFFFLWGGLFFSDFILGYISVVIFNLLNIVKNEEFAKILDKKSFYLRT